VSLQLHPASAAPRVLVDAHLHYNADAAKVLPAARIREIFDANGVERAVITSTPPALAASLHAELPARILPILGVYRDPQDKERWHQDPTLPAWVRQQLESDIWRGVGELHLFAEQRRNPVFEQIVDVAHASGLPIQLHADPAVVDALFERVPDARVVWAHAGAYPYPSLLRDYLRRYPNLYVDLSMRDERIAPGGVLDASWEQLLIERADRFMVGVDTFSVRRWREFSRHTAVTRAWLAQLPKQTAEVIARDNALRVYGATASPP
jgi:predicted TIM-barrel fold metal-dependent hydrolase